MENFVSIIAAVIAFVVTAALGKVLIPWLHKLKYGQPIKEIGPTWHSAKSGTPTMGGLTFLAGVGIAVCVCLPLYWSAAAEPVSTERCVMMWAGLIMGVLYGIVGFADDYLKVVRHNNDGLSFWQKIISQTGIAAAYLAAMWISGDNGKGATTIPFVEGQVELGFWFYIIALVMIVGFVNAVNLTDGIDGLCGSVTFFAAVSFMFSAALVQILEISIIGAALAGGCLGFLVWNFYPAKVFMGDTGSLFLGGMFCALAFGMDMPILIPLVGIIYLCEAGSVIIQRYYFKLTHGKRIFKMSPIHHHFEMCGWSEIKIVTVFSIVTFIAGIVTALLVGFGS
ncbi:MAG: phospho-N-acetylmuramoyl-pentapeptide-transferase [Clostridia bacterium]|nr:phospho-N-acetylmuramoyl-pentapeptide-transferase [Clostridia bacterium]